MRKMQQRGVSQYGDLPAEMSRLPSDPATDPGDATLVAMKDNAQPQHQPQPGLGDSSLAEAASPISSRPPNSSVGINFEEIMPVPGELPDEDTLACYEADRGGRGGIAGGNRWPRQETLALLKIRSDMDAAFREATLKVPLWEDVSRKLAELGYKRSAKKCREKFENVHKYYKRTKEGRAGRQVGKAYKFFNQLEALASNNTDVSAAATSIMPRSANPIPITTKINTNSQLVTAAAVPVSIGIGITNLTPVVSSTVENFSPSPTTLAQPQPQPLAVPFPTTGSRANAPVLSQDLSAGPAKPTTRSSAASASVGVCVSYDDSSSLSSSSSGSDNELDDEEVAAAMEVERDLEGVQVSPSHYQLKRKRKRASGSGQQMMEFFEGLMKQVMLKQGVMQQRFLENIEKREQDRMIREEAWKRQEMARVSREHELMAKERAMSSSKDAAIIAFLQKITGQTIQLPHVVLATISDTPQPQTPSILLAPSPLPQPLRTLWSHKTLQPQQERQQQQHYQQQQHQQHHLPQTLNVEVTKKHQPSIVSSQLGNNIAGVPEEHVQLSLREIGDKDTTASQESPSSSRWPKVEVLALIKLRSGLESRYQEPGPKGPLWEEISAAMQRMGYKRSAKRCKEKWENINKYFKKVKESNKKRSEDAKTCPYFHELDAMYRNKILTVTSGGGSTFSSNQNMIVALQQQQQRRGEISLTIHPSLNNTSLQEGSDQPVVMPSSETNGKSDQNKCEGNSDLHHGTGGLTATLFGEGNYSTVTDVGVKKPEDAVKKKRHEQRKLQQVMIDSDKAEDTDSDNVLGQDENSDDGDHEEEEEEEMKMAYNIDFQRQNATSSSNGRENGAPTSLAMVQ
ncbi:hypothetical protein NMG60_11026815 [Bertholletia excelsa]